MTSANLDTVPDIKLNRKLEFGNVPPLIFFEVAPDTNEIIRDPMKELQRAEIWIKMHEEGKSLTVTAQELKLATNTTKAGYDICRTRYAEWVSTHALMIFGDPSQRLFKHIQRLEDIFDDTDDRLQHAEFEKSVPSFLKIKLDVLKEVGKLQGIEPTPTMTVELTSAESTRKLMQKLFPTSDAKVPDKTEVNPAI